MLTGSQSIDGEVLARAIVFEQTRPAHGNKVSFPAGRLDVIIAVRLSARLFQDLGARSQVRQPVARPPRIVEHLGVDSS